MPLIKGGMSYWEKGEIREEKESGEFGANYSYDPALVLVSFSCVGMHKVVCMAVVYEGTHEVIKLQGKKEY